MAPASKPERTVSIVAAKTSFEGSVDGTVVRVFEGDLFRSDDPAVKKWPDLFGPVHVRSTTPRPRVEQATAAPGEQRGE